MSVLPFKRFIICYKILINNEYIKQPPIIVKFKNRMECINKTCTKLNIPNIQIDRDDNKSGYIYCNEIYNPEINTLTEIDE